MKNPACQGGVLKPKVRYHTNRNQKVDPMSRYYNSGAVVNGFSTGGAA